VAAARNTGLRAAQGEVIGFLDQDDLWPDGRLASLLPYFSGDAQLEAAYGFMQRMRLVETPGEGDRYEPFREPMFSSQVGAGLFRGTVFERLGVFDDTLMYCVDDFDFFLRARESGVRMAYTRQVTLYYRLHDTNTSLSGDVPLGSYYAEALKRSLDRRRRAHAQDVPPLPQSLRRELMRLRERASVPDSKNER
jgi:glycosyltransferase involved in cell wall biosynthesis